jgi:hypothetical protein
VLAYLLDENEFLGPHGIRSLSRYHLKDLFVFHIGGEEYKVQYLLSESNTGMFGGSSKWPRLLDLFGRVGAKDLEMEIGQVYAGACGIKWAEKRRAGTGRFVKDIPKAAAATSRGQPLHTAPYRTEPQALQTSNDSDLAELAGRTTPRSPSAENGAKHAYVDDDTPFRRARRAGRDTVRNGVEMSMRLDTLYTWQRYAAVTLTAPILIWTVGVGDGGGRRRHRHLESVRCAVCAQAGP